MLWLSVPFGTIWWFPSLVVVEVVSHLTCKTAPSHIVPGKFLNLLCIHSHTHTHTRSRLQTHARSHWSPNTLGASSSQTNHFNATRHYRSRAKGSTVETVDRNSPGRWLETSWLAAQTSTEQLITVVPTSSGVYCHWTNQPLDACAPVTAA